MMCVCVILTTLSVCVWMVDWSSGHEVVTASSSMHATNTQIHATPFTARGGGGAMRERGEERGEEGVE